MDTLDNIIKLLNQQGKKQKDLTDYLGIHKNAFTNWKGGNNNSYLKYLPQIAEFLNVSVERLIGAENKNEPERRKVLLDFFSSMSDEELEAAYAVAKTVAEKYKK